MSQYPDGWDQEMEEWFVKHYGEVRRVRGELPENPDAGGGGLKLRRAFLVDKFGMLPQEGEREESPWR